jgi:chromosome segregation ATPase
MRFLVVIIKDIKPILLKPSKKPMLCFSVFSHLNVNIFEPTAILIVRSSRRRIMRRVKWIAVSFLIFLFSTKVNALPSKDIKVVKEQSQKAINSREKFNNLRGQEAVSKNRLEAYRNDIMNQRDTVNNAQDRSAASHRALLERQTHKNEVEALYANLSNELQDGEHELLQKRDEYQENERRLRSIRDEIRRHFGYIRESNLRIVQEEDNIRARRSRFFARIRSNTNVTADEMVIIQQAEQNIADSGQELSRLNRQEADTDTNGEHLKREIDRLTAELDRIGQELSAKMREVADALREEG